MNEECLATMVRAYESGEEWPDRLRAVAYEVIDGLSRDPAAPPSGSRCSPPATPPAPAAT